LPAIVTMVVYHGAEEWAVPPTLAEATDADAALRPYILDFRYSLVDLGRIPDANLSNERGLRVGLLILKHGPLGRADRKKLLRLGREALRLGHDDLVTLIYYLLGDLDGPKSELVRDILKELVPGEEDTVMSVAAEQWKAEGFDKGVRQGRAEGKAEGKAEMLIRLLQRRFQPLPVEVEGRVRSASGDQLDEWSERLVDGKSLTEIFGPDHTH